MSRRRFEAGVTLRIARSQMRDIVRGRWYLAYLVLFGLLTEGLLRFSGGGPRGLLTVAELMLFIVPLVTIVFGTMYFYQAREFIELLLAQPVSRGSVFAGLFAGLMIPLCGACVAGVGIPYLLHGAGSGREGGTLLTVILVGLALTLVQGALGLLIAVRTPDRLRGLGLALGVWFLAAVAYDGFVLLLVSLLADYPLERPMLGLMLANPIDLGRVLLLLRFDIAALLGYTGTVFQQFFGGARGVLVAAGGLLLWIGMPLWWAARSFARKDF